MGWFPCIGSTEKKKKKSDRRDPPKPSTSTPAAASTSVSASTSRAKGKTKVNPAMTSRKDVNLQSNVKRQLKLQTSLNEGPNSSGGGSENRQAQTFTFHQLQVATKNFNCLLGAGGFGKVYEGNLEGGQAVAVKKLNPDSQQGNKEFLVEVLMLSLFYHPNLVKLIGYCTENNQRLLVYEYMPLGSLDDHLHGCKPNRRSLDWNARMKIAVGAAKGLEYLHDRANPPVIFRDMKSANILLEEGYHAKLSDFGLAKLGPTGDQTHVSTVVMGTHGYCAPEYLMTGQLTTRSDMYSFGVVLLEILTGRVANDSTKPVQEGNLVAWARPQLKNRKNFHRMVDPRLNGLYPSVGLYQVLAIAAMCVQEQASSRPLIGEVVTALSYLASQTYTPRTQSTQSPRAAPSTSTSSPRPRVCNTQIDGSSGSKKS